MDKSNKQTIYNVLSFFIIGGINFVTAPIFTRVLGVEQFGYYSVAYSWIALFACAMGLQTNEALTTGIYDFSENYYAFRSATLSLGTLFSGILIAICLLFIKPLAHFISFPPKIIIFILLTSFSLYIFKFTQKAFIFEKKAEINLIISSSLVLTIVLLSLYLIKQSSANERYIGRITGFSVPYIVLAVGEVVYLFRKKPVIFHAEYWKYSLAIGVPIIFNELAQNVLTQSDRIMMQKFGTESLQIGVYSFFNSFSSGLSMLLMALNASWCPIYYDALEAKNEKEIREKNAHYIELFSVVSCGFVLLSREVSLLMAGNDYEFGIEVLPIFCICIFSTSVYYNSVNFEIYQKKTKAIALGTMGAATLNITLNAVMIPLWGMYGAGAATAISYIALAVVHLCIAKKMGRGLFHLTFISFLPWTMLFIVAIMLFFLFPEQWYIRWGLGMLMGLVELVRILRRKSVF